MEKEKNYIIEFANYIVLGFIRVENLHALFKKSRAYNQYTYIPEMLGKYINASGDDNRKNTLNDSINNETKHMYTDILKYMKKIKSLDGLKGNDVDKLNSIVHRDYNITENKFFSSVTSNDKAPNSDNIDEDLLKYISKFISEYEKLKNRLSKKHIKKQKGVARDLLICMMISATEFTNTLHHVYIAYYVYKYDTKEHKNNIQKAIKHLQRAILDIQEALNISDQKDIQYEHIKQRLDKIYNVGQNIK